MNSTPFSPIGPPGDFPALSAALAYTRHGWKLLPVRGKVPATDRGCLDATDDPETLRELWSRPEAGRYGVALATGEPSGVWVLDIDGEEGATELRRLLDRHGRLPDTVTARTGGGGWHLLFRMPRGRDVRNSASRVGRSIDVRGTGGYIVLPPSRHPSGRPYRWTTGAGPDRSRIASAPAWLLDLVSPREPARPTGGRVNLRGLVPGRPTGERERIVSALDALSAALAYDEWVRVGMALHDHDPGPGGFALWNAWSSRSTKYPGERVLQKHWRSFSAGPVTVGTLYHLAKAAGWNDPGRPEVDLRSLLRRHTGGAS